MSLLPALERYPRTTHLEGSGIPSSSERVPFLALAGRQLVVEEKLEGGHLCLLFDDAGALHLAHRGQYLSGSLAEVQFAPVKIWAQTFSAQLHDVLGSRYELHGECLYAWHTVYYDSLPHWFVEYDVRDRLRGEFLSTHRRQELLAGLPLVSAPVLHLGALERLEDLTALLEPSRYKSPAWREAFLTEAAKIGLDSGAALALVDDSAYGEGLYVKVEEDGQVVERYKWVRAGFLEALLKSGHWSKRPLLPNRLASTISIYS